MKPAKLPDSLAARWEPWLVAAVVGLLTSCWLLPTEAAIDGETGWRALAWILLAFLWSLTSSTPLDFRRWPLEWRLAALGAGLLVVGHIVGGVSVLVSVGQKRHSANLLVEWLGLAAAWWVCAAVATQPRWRGRIAVPLVSTAICVAGLGIWQHDVSLPNLAQQYRETFQALRQGTATPEKMSQLTAAGIPLTDPGLTLFEKRLLNSREPFGLFGLANTLGGFLASACLWLAGGMLVVAGRSSVSRKQLVVPGVGLALLTWCLFLTKSRTSLVGVAAGGLLLLLGVLAGRQGTFMGQTWPRGRRLAAALGLVVVLALVPLALLAVGAWDLEVITESTKSLGYRWQYWVGSSRLIATSPWIGVGLGQFREQYLQVKLPAASEEIMDPHSLWLDAWANGGLLSVLGLLLVVSSGIVLIGKALSSISDSESRARKADAEEKLANTHDGLFVGLGSFAGFVLVFGAGLLSNHWDDRLLVLGPVFLFVCVTLVQTSDLQGELSRGLSGKWPGLAGAVGLFVHLHAAGGFETSAVLTWMGWLGALALTANAGVTPASTVDERSSRGVSRWVTPLGLGVMGIVAVGLYRGGALCRWELDRASHPRMLSQPAAMERVLTQAAAADAWNPEPWRQLAELRFAQASSISRLSTYREQVSSALAALEQSELRDPRNPHVPDRRGEILSAAFQRTEDAQWAQNAVDAFRQAHAGYPTNVSIGVHLARAELAIGNVNQARDVAQQTLHQDELNRELGHVERWLSDEDLADMQRLSVAGVDQGAE